MSTLQLKDIERRVAKNTAKNNDKIETVTNRIKSRNLNKGRLRPRDPAEKRILSRFDKGK